MPNPRSSKSFERAAAIYPGSNSVVPAGDPGKIRELADVLKDTAKASEGLRRLCEEHAKPTPPAHDVGRTVQRDDSIARARGAVKDGIHESIRGRKGDPAVADRIGDFAVKEAERNHGTVGGDGKLRGGVVGEIVKAQHDMDRNPPQTAPEAPKKAGFKVP